MRKNPILRSMVSETRLSLNDLIYPIFVKEGIDSREEVRPMPGIHQLSVDALVEEAKEVHQLGITAILLFGIPDYKDSLGTAAYKSDGVIQMAIQSLKKHIPELMLITDVCMCDYTDHGHCGVVLDNGIDNDRSLELLARIALSHVESGADMVAPSAMMDGQVGAIRNILNQSRFSEIPIMGYSAKYASSFYGPFRVAAESSPQFGDRKSYQMDIANRNQAMIEIQQDINEGADIVMVKPALANLDVIHEAKVRFSHPIAAYNVSGEYAMVKAASENGWIDGEEIALEIITSIKRSGADIIISYHAKELAGVISSS